MIDILFSVLSDRFEANLEPIITPSLFLINFPSIIFEEIISILDNLSIGTPLNKPPED